MHTDRPTETDKCNATAHTHYIHVYIYTVKPLYICILFTATLISMKEWCTIIIDKQRRTKVKAVCCILNTDISLP